MTKTSSRGLQFLLMALSVLVFATPTRAQIVIQPDTPGRQIEIDNQGKKTKFISNTILVKLTPQARANLKVKGEDVDPAATGVASLDAICREHGVRNFRAIIAARDPNTPINSWFKLKLSGNDEPLALVETSNDDAVNVALSGDEPLGQLIRRLKQDANVESVALDYVVEPMFLPNDPYYSGNYATSKYGNTSQWAPQFIGAPQAWDATLGNASVVIAIVDTGIDAKHPEFAGKVVLEKNYVKGEKILDLFGHGTHVAGIAAALINNGTGIAGICGGCSLMSVKVLDAGGSGMTSDVASGIVYATDNGARVINLSLGGSGRSIIIRDALDYALGHNVLPVVAMGNANSDFVGDLGYWYSALGVGALDKNGQKASFSNFGLQTGVTAPGVGGAVHHADLRRHAEHAVRLQEKL